MCLELLESCVCFRHFDRIMKNLRKEKVLSYFGFLDLRKYNISHQLRKKFSEKIWGVEDGVVRRVNMDNKSLCSHQIN